MWYCCRIFDNGGHKSCRKFDIAIELLIMVATNPLGNHPNANVFGFSYKQKTCREYDNGFAMIRTMVTNPRVMTNPGARWFPESLRQLPNRCASSRIAAPGSSSSFCEPLPSSLRRRVKGVGVWFEKQREVVRGWRVVWKKEGGCKGLVCGLKKKRSL